jgi:hypothetical protein
MKMKLIIATAITACIASSVNAAVVTGNSFSFATGPEITGGVTSGGVPVATASGINANLGFFNAGFDFAAAVTTSDFGSLLGNYNIIASGLIGATASAFGEDYAGLINFSGNLTATAGSPSIGQQLMIWYSPVGDAATVLGLLNTGQVVAVDGFPPTEYTLSPATGTALIGEIGSAQFSAGALGLSEVSAPAFELIPEPSVALLGAFGVLGLLRRRR